MTLPSGQISFNEVNVELTRTATAQLEANDTTVRGLANVVTAGSVISMNDLRGKAFVNLVISADTSVGYDVYASAAASPAYSPGVSFVQVTVNPGVVVGSTTPVVSAMSIPNQFSPTDNVRIINQGTIAGKGGNGGFGGQTNGSVGSSGDSAITAQRSVSIDNQGTIAGGGGGGGGGGGFTWPRPAKQGGPIAYFGGGGGGGAGYDPGSGGGPPSVIGGTATLTTAGSGATGASPVYYPLNDSTYYPGSGGNGGGLGNSGSPGQFSTVLPGPVGPPVLNFNTFGQGGTAGNYIVGNPFVTWINNGTRQGGVA